MAGTQAPLFGLGASGSIGGVLTYATWRGRPYVRVKVTPSNPQSDGQLSTRSMFKFLSQAWAALSAPQKASWDALAAVDNILPFNAYVRYNMDLWTQFTMPKVDPDQAAGTAPVLGALTLTGGVGQFSVSQVITTVNGMWGLAIATQITLPAPPVKADVILVRPYVASPVTGVVTGLDAGTYEVSTLAFNIGGTASAWLAEQTVVVT
jgi:hypothetical protein